MILKFFDILLPSSPGKKTGTKGGGDCGGKCKKGKCTLEDQCKGGKWKKDKGCSGDWCGCCKKKSKSSKSVHLQLTLHNSRPRILKLTEVVDAICGGKHSGTRNSF